MASRNIRRKQFGRKKTGVENEFPTPVAEIADAFN
jgi:hypothetical protein